MEKAAFNTNKTLFTSKLYLNLRKQLMKCYIWHIAMYGVETWDISDSRPEIPGKFINVVLEKNGKDVRPIL